jgi:hypothetical protein
MMKASWRARIREGAISFLALFTLVSILYVVDFRVREGAIRVTSAATEANATQFGAQVTADASKMLATARDQSAEHAAMMGFVGTAGVLLLFMLKS